MFPLRNNSSANRAFTFLRALLPQLAVAVLLVGGPVQQLRAQDLRAQGAPVPFEAPEARENPGRFNVRSASTELRSGVYFLNASVEYQLSSEAEQALRSGVPLTIRIDVQFLNSRRFWFDGEDAALRQLYELQFHALSERFIVTNLNSGDQTSFATLFSTLNYLGRIDELPLIDAALIDPDRDYDLRLRAVLDVEQFPGPLRLLAFWRRDWSLASDWYRWPLQND